jgi:prevent-host-death family protein
MVRDAAMEEIAISKFKATCLAVLERVRKSHTPIRVTRFGEPIADVLPASVTPKSGSWIGSMAGTARIRKDIVGPVADDEDWDALR